MLGVADIIVVIILLLQKPWFDGSARGERPGTREARLSP